MSERRSNEETLAVIFPIPTRSASKSEAEGEGRPDQTPKAPRNELALAILKEIRERRKGSPLLSDGGSSDYLREARSGGMYGGELALDDR